MQWEGDEWVYGRRWRPVRTGFGCFGKTRWVPVDEYYRARNSQPVRSFFRLLGIVPVVQDPRIHYILFDPWDPWYYGGGWDAPLPFPHGGGDWGYWALGLGAGAERRRYLEGIYAHIMDPTQAEVVAEWEEWRAARHRENIARIDGQINEIAGRHHGYLDELMRGWQDGGDPYDDNPDRRRLHLLRREVEELQQQRDRLDREDLERYRHERERQDQEDLERYRRERADRRLGRILNRFSDGYYHRYR